jgi:hypothetical protein
MWLGQLKAEAKNGTAREEVIMERVKDIGQQMSTADFILYTAVDGYTNSNSVTDYCSM